MARLANDEPGPNAAHVPGELHKFPDWAVAGIPGRERRLSHLHRLLNPPEEEVTNLRLLRRWQEIEKNEIRFKEYYLD